MSDRHPPSEEELETNEAEHIEDDSAYEKRKRMARLVAFIGLAAFIVWGASWIQKAFPHKVELRYVYRDVPSVGDITKVEASVADDEGIKARVVFYHHDDIRDGGRRYYRTQNLQLAKGVYRLKVSLHYKNNSRRVMQSALNIREAGRYYVYLKRSKPAS